MSAQAEQRWRYEAEVRDLRRVADAMLDEGRPMAEVARQLVDRRNGLKAAFRSDLDPVVLMAIEARNVAKCGNAIGPAADDLRDRYGSWDAVVDAACRPANLSGRIRDDNV